MCGPLAARFARRCGPSAVPILTNTPESPRILAPPPQRFRGISPMFAAIRRPTEYRGAQIRTGDLGHPKAARYQAAPRPVNSRVYCHSERRRSIHVRKHSSNSGSLVRTINTPGLARAANGHISGCRCSVPAVRVMPATVKYGEDAAAHAGLTPPSTRPGSPRRARSEQSARSITASRRLTRVLFDHCSPTLRSRRQAGHQVLGVSGQAPQPVAVPHDGPPQRAGNLVSVQWVGGDSLAAKLNPLVWIGLRRRR